MAHTHNEYERSYDVRGELGAPDFVGAVGVVAADAPLLLRLEARYFDTEELVLAGNRIAVRRRTGGGDDGWHIKRSRATHRSEQHWPLDEGDASAAAVPAALVAELEPLLAGRAIAPVALVRNRRTVSVLRSADGAAVAEFCDDRVEAVRLADGRELAWREWEIELSGAYSAADEAACAVALDAFEARILAAGGAPSATGSKLARALGGASGTEQHHAHPRAEQEQS